MRYGDLSAAVVALGCALLALSAIIGGEGGRQWFYLAGMSYASVYFSCRAMRNHGASRDESR